MNPLEALSPTIIAQFRHPQDPTPAARAKYRARIRKEVMGCEACELYKGDAHVPFYGPGATARFVVVGEAPGPEEAKKGRPFVGPSGKLLRAMFKDAGIDATNDVLWCNTVSCFPNIEGKVRAPSKDETLACRGHLLDQVEAAYQPFVLLVGAKALGAVRSDVTLAASHGELFVWNDLYVCMAIYHPAAVLRGQHGYKPLIKADLKRWHDIVYGGDDPFNFIGEHCFKCGKVAEMWDRDAVPMCMDHWKKWKNQWEKERRRWSESPAIQLTF